MQFFDQVFEPTTFGFFLRQDWDIHGIQFYEKDHPSIDKTIMKDWRRINLFLSKDRDFVTIWHGVIEAFMADEEYQRINGFEWSLGNEIEILFRGHIRNMLEAKIILNAIGGNKYSPQYLGE